MGELRGVGGLTGMGSCGASGGLTGMGSCGASGRANRHGELRGIGDRLAARELRSLRLTATRLPGIRYVRFGGYGTIRAIYHARSGPMIPLSTV